MATLQTGTLRHKTFEYSVSTAWTHDRQGRITSDGKPSVEVSSPPEFRGAPGIWSPEDLFVAAVDVCQMTTFLALAIRSGLPLRSYDSTARGTLEFADGGYRFTQITVSPKIIVAPGTDLASVGLLVEQAHQSCLIGRSTQAEITVQPIITVEG